MASEKSKVVIYEGEEEPQIGDILWFNGNNWIRLPAGTEGQILTIVDEMGNKVPRWQTIIS